MLSAFSRSGMTLKLKKCGFAKPEIEFVGHTVGSGRISVLKSKTEAISRIKEPTCKKLLRSFLGMASYYRSFIKNFSDIVAPLTELTKSKQTNHLVFNDEQRNAFVAIKNSLTNAEFLNSPDYTKPFEIHTDASNYAIGACLCQRDDKGIEKPISFFSNKLTDTQQRWSTIEKEAFAVIASLQKFDVMVFGSSINLYTDHNPLTYLVQSVPKSGKLTRWALALQRYDISVKHRSGKSNANADCLSRMDFD